MSFSRSRNSNFSLLDIFRFFFSGLLLASDFDADSGGGGDAAAASPVPTAAAESSVSNLSAAVFEPPPPLSPPPVLQHHAEKVTGGWEGGRFKLSSPVRISSDCTQGARRYPTQHRKAGTNLMRMDSTTVTVRATRQYSTATLFYIDYAINGFRGPKGPENQRKYIKNAHKSKQKTLL